MPGSSSQGIFLCYRREDAAPYARLLQSQLRERFPGARVFMDLDSIEAGLDFAEVIGEAVDSCAVLVALIGRQWVTLVDEEGHRRLDNPGDYVRFEIQTALERGVRVIPILVDGAKPLRPQQLPSELHKLARLNALELSYGRYEYDAGRLLDLIQRVLPAIGEPAGAAHQVREQAARQAGVEAELPGLEERARLAGEAGDAAGAATAYKDLLAGCVRVLGPEHPDTLAAQYELARWTGRAGDAAAARQQFAALLPMYERVLGPMHPDTLAARDQLAHWTGRAGDAAAARDRYAALLSDREQVSGPEHPDTLAVRGHLAYWAEQADRTP